MGGETRFSGFWSIGKRLWGCGEIRGWLTPPNPRRPRHAAANTIHLQDFNNALGMHPYILGMVEDFISRPLSVVSVRAAEGTNRSRRTCSFSGLTRAIL